MKLLQTLAFLLGEQALEASSPWAVLWSGPGVLIASVLIAWGAEAAQFFVAQGIALAILAWLQTLPEFAVEAVIAWHRDTPDLLANLTGALRLLTGLGWPLIYFAASRSHRAERHAPLRRIELEPDQAVQVVCLFIAVLWQFVVWWKGDLTVVDAAILLGIYAGYLWMMRRLPPEEAESIDDIGAVPRAIVRASRPKRIMAIGSLFLVGGAGVFMVAEPFVRGLLGLSTMLGIARPIFIAWIAPVVSEAPEGISAFYWARDYERAPVALMNLVSSNISQWTLLAAMLPVVFSFSAGHVSPIVFDTLQSREMILTLAQSLLAAVFLLNMELDWWEAVGLLVLWVVQLVFSTGRIGDLVHLWVTWIYFLWCAVEVGRLVTGNRKFRALGQFGSLISPPSRPPSHRQP
jgi:cation:H+ antiporter